MLQQEAYHLLPYHKKVHFSHWQSKPENNWHEIGVYMVAINKTELCNILFFNALA